MTQYSRQVQTQAQQQVQTLSPQQILVVKLLELPTLELEERIHSELLDNPALEEGKEPSEDHEDHEDNFATDEDGEPNSDYGEDLSLGDYRTEDDIPDYKLQENNRSKGETPEEIPFSDNVSFYETLKEQLDMQNLTPEEKQLGEYLIGSLDDDGLLRKSTESLMDELAIYQGIYTSPEQLEHVLSIIQDFDPAGIGARSLQECLLLQIQRKENSPLKQIELDIIGKCCDEFTRKNKDKIIQKLGITEEQYNAATAELTKLNPRPGSSLGETIGKNLQQIIPDFIVDTEDDGTVTLTLNNRNVTPPFLFQINQSPEPGVYGNAGRTYAQQSKPEQGVEGCTDVPETESGCGTRIYQCCQTASADLAQHHAGHHRPAASVLSGRR